MSQPILLGLPPVFPESMHTLVLGSLPGTASLRQVQYYAHPRNAFWHIMATTFGWPADLAYSDRLERLKGRGIGLWDVIEQASRLGSLDSAIEITGLQTNPLAALITSRSELKVICFNGKKAYQVFRSSVMPDIDPKRGSLLSIFILPSTSPAHAALSWDQKAQQWQQALVRDTRAHAEES